MNSPQLLLTVAAVAAALGTVLLLIRRYPLPVLRRWIHCPEFNALARVGLKRQENRWGNFTFADVRECSMFSKGPVTCNKQCLRSAS